MVTRYVVPTGSISRLLWHAARMLAACASVMRLLGVSTPTAAFEKIIWPEADDDPEHPEYIQRPRIIVVDGQNYSLQRLGTGSFGYTGSVVFGIEQPAFAKAGYWHQRFWPASYWPTNYWAEPSVSKGDRYLRASNLFGAIVDEVKEFSGKTPAADHIQDPLPNSYPKIKRIDQVLPIMHSDPADWGGAYFAAAEFRITWDGGV